MIQFERRKTREEGKRSRSGRGGGCSIVKRRKTSRHDGMRLKPMNRTCYSMAFIDDFMHVIERAFIIDVTHERYLRFVGGVSFAILRMRLVDHSGEEE